MNGLFDHQEIAELGNTSVPKKQDKVELVRQLRAAIAKMLSKGTHGFNTDQFNDMIKQLARLNLEENDIEVNNSTATKQAIVSDEGERIFVRSL